MMKAAVIANIIKSFSEISLKQIPIPTLRPGYALIKVTAASVNPIDYKIATRGRAGWVTPYPYTPGYDFAGTIADVADDVTNLSVGKEVFGTNFGQKRHDEPEPNPVIAGSFAEYMLVKASKVSLKPKQLSFQTAAGIGIAGTTANEAINKIGQVTSGSRLLVLGGSSAVGLIAIQLAKLNGAIVTATTSTRNKDFVASLGTDNIITYDTQPWESIDSPDFKHFDVVLDCVGGKHTLQTCRAKHIVKSDGKYITIVDHSIGQDPLQHPPLKFAASFLCSQDTMAQDKLAQLIVEKKLNIPIHKQFDFTEQGVREIFETSISGRSVGKNILNIVN